MNKKDLKKLIVNKNGKLLNGRKFQYRGTVYHFNYFIKDGNQSSNFFFKHGIKGDYIKQIKKFKEKGIIENKEKEQFYISFLNVVYYTSLLPFPFFIASFFVCILLLGLAIVFPPLYWICSSKIEYEDLDIRIKELEKGKSVCPDQHLNSIPYTEKEKLNGAFRNLMMHDYALKTENKIIITFENYQEMKKKGNV